MPDLEKRQPDRGSSPQNEAACVRLVRVVRHETGRDLHDWTVDVELNHDSTQADTQATDRHRALRDAVQQAVQQVAQQTATKSIEGFAQELVAFLLSRDAQVCSAAVTVRSYLWKRLASDGSPHPTAFMKGSAELQATRVLQSQDGQTQVRSGFSGMTVLNCTGSLLSATLEAEWTYTTEVLASAPVFNQVRMRLREDLIRSFAQPDETDPQQLVQTMAQTAVTQTDQVQQLTLRLERHPYLPDASQDLDVGKGTQIFVPGEEPPESFGATAQRAHP